ncbi:uncharacterized protein C8A04DRAFT_30234 [Dichotomopilus funicola]|uniref:Uncharacterized protein n=1 Tax=Dichotomopilus funicola TaxID=1934379 RepID=A0AAN6UZU9_9PEZI|nr:hypothetical protein C8A04DRAFT_30234 [Dichotomopilus funicola]
MCLIQVTHFQCGHTFEGRTRRCAAYHERRVAAAPTLCNFPLFRHHSTHTRTSQCPDTRRNNKEAPTMCSQACVQRLMDRQRKQEREELRQEQQKRERARAVARQYRAAKDKAEQWEAAVQQRARERQQELERERERERQTGRGQRSRGKPPVPPKDEPMGESGSRGFSSEELFSEELFTVSLIEILPGKLVENIPDETRPEKHF